MKTKIKFLLIAVGIFISGNLLAQTKQDETYLDVLQQEVTSLQEQIANPSPLLSQDDLAYLQALLLKTQWLVQQELQAQAEAQELAIKNQPPVQAPNHINAPLDPNNIGNIPSFVTTGDPIQDAAIIQQWMISKGLTKPE
jgi:hypothetical protein